MDTEKITGAAETLSVEQQLAEQKKLGAEQSKQIAALNELVKTKVTEISIKAPVALTIPTAAVKVGDKEYKWTVPAFKMPATSEITTAEAASTDPEILKAILKIEGQGLLIEIF